MHSEMHSVWQNPILPEQLQEEENWGVSANPGSCKNGCYHRGTYIIYYIYNYYIYLYAHCSDKYLWYGKMLPAHTVKIPSSQVCDYIRLCQYPSVLPQGRGIWQENRQVYCRQAASCLCWANSWVVDHLSVTTHCYGIHSAVTRSAQHRSIHLLNVLSRWKLTGYCKNKITDNFRQNNNNSGSGKYKLKKLQSQKTSPACLLDIY